MKRFLFFRDKEGSIVLEAAIILPFFLAFVLLLNSFIQLAIVDSKVQRAVGETTKQIATHFGPVDVLYQEAKLRTSQSKPAALLRETAERIRTAREKVLGAEQAAEQFESFIPEPVLQLIEWEKTRREQLETAGENAVDGLLHRSVDPVVNRGFTPIVLHYADEGYLKQEHFRVSEVIFPDLDNREQAFFGIEAEYEYRLPIPFIRKTVLIRKKALERVWVGR